LNAGDNIADWIR